jgi:hypothetical protein
MPARVGTWRFVQVRRDPKLHPRLQAKQFKLLSHRIFPRGRLALRYAPFSLRRCADLSIGIDGSIRIKSASFVRDMRVRLGGNAWAMFVHPDRDCIYGRGARQLPTPLPREANSESTVWIAERQNQTREKATRSIVHLRRSYDGTVVRSNVRPPSLNVARNCAVILCTSSSLT